MLELNNDGIEPVSFHLKKFDEELLGSRVRWDVD